MNFIETFLSRSAFPKIESSFFEYKKLGLIRIIAGSIVFVRYWQIASATHVFTGQFSLALIIFLIVCGLFILGFATPIATILLIILSHRIDMLFSTTTLGTSILSELLLILLLGGGGYYYSVDRSLLNSTSGLLSGPKKIIEWLYSITQLKTVNNLQKLYFLVFLLYGVSSFTALWLHITDSNWMSGLTTRSLLTSPYLCSSWNFFRAFEYNLPVLLSILSIIAGIFQSIFQFLMILLVWNPIGRAFVFIWGIIFFITSILFINLSYLPHLEILLWVAIFIPIKLSREQIAIYYDDRCNLCVRSMKFLYFFNFNNSILFKPLSLNRNDLENSGYTDKEVKSYMLGRFKGKFYLGYDLYFLFIRKNPLYWILIPVFCLGYILNIGKRIYNYIAENRYRYFGTCEITDPKQFQIADNTLSEARPLFFKNFVFMFYSFLIPAFFIIKICDFNGFTSFFKTTGLERPNVFNKVDLTMGDKWAEIYRYDAIKKEYSLTPLIGTNGERLSYSGTNWFLFANHNSDFLYFGTTLDHARSMIDLKGPEEISRFHTKQSGLEFLKKRIIYDYNYLKLRGNVEYKVIVYASSSSKATHWETNSKRHNKEIITVFVCYYNGVNFQITQGEKII